MWENLLDFQLVHITMKLRQRTFTKLKLTCISGHCIGIMVTLEETIHMVDLITIGVELTGQDQSDPWEYEEGKGLNLDVVLKLNYPSDNPTMYTSIVSGTFRSTSSIYDLGYFKPISIFSLPVLSNYNYSLISKELEGGLSGSKDPKNLSLNLQSSRFCSVLSGRLVFFELEYASECKTVKYCSLLSE